jgi:hypothetical protein
MVNGKTVSLKSVLWKVFRNPAIGETSYEEAAEFAIEALQLINTPLVKVNKVSDLIEVKEHKAFLPDDILTLRGIRIINNEDDFSDGAIALTHATDIYHQGMLCDDPEDSQFRQELTYEIQQNKIILDVEEAFIQISYQALGTDKDGFPTIPDNRKVKLALEYYILYRLLEPYYDLGKISDKAFNRITQNKDWYMGAAQSDTKVVSMDHWEAVMNSINRLIVNDTAHQNFFKGMGKQERIRKFR